MEPAATTAPTTGRRRRTREYVFSRRWSARLSLPGSMCGCPVPWPDRRPVSRRPRREATWSGRQRLAQRVAGAQARAVHSPRPSCLHSPHRTIERLVIACSSPPSRALRARRPHGPPRRPRARGSPDSRTSCAGSRSSSSTPRASRDRRMAARSPTSSTSRSRIATTPATRSTCSRSAWAAQEEVKANLRLISEQVDRAAGSARMRELTRRGGPGRAVVDFTACPRDRRFLLPRCASRRSRWPPPWPRPAPVPRRPTASPGVPQPAHQRAHP